MRLSANSDAIENFSCPLYRNQIYFCQFYFSNMIALTFFIYEPNFMDKFLQKNVGKLMSRNFKWCDDD